MSDTAPATYGTDDPIVMRCEGSGTPGDPTPYGLPVGVVTGWLIWGAS